MIVILIICRFMANLKIMTFEDALIKKREIGETILIDKHKMRVWVVPAGDDDFKRYRLHYKKTTRKQKSDEIAKLYATDNNYEVCAIYVTLSAVFSKKLS